MDLVLAWILFPAVALTVCVGFGLLVERASGARVPGVLLAALGMAGLVSASQLTTFWDATAEATLPLCVALAGAGLVLGRARLRDIRGRLDLWALAAAAGVFGVFAAPIVLSGQATFAGYTVLGDTSIHFIGADALLTYGRDFASLAPSSYEYSLSAYYGANGYPSGGPTAVAVLTSLVGQDVAWTFQPFLSLLAALMCLALYALLEPLIASRPVRAAAAFVAAQPALVLAYALQGSVKEVGTAFGIVLVGALLAVWARQAPDGARRVIPMAVAFSATVGIVGLAAGVWLGPFALAMAVAALARRVPVKRLLAAAALGGGVTAVLCYQALADLATYVDVAGGVVTSQKEFGNLLGPLDERQRFGVWLTGDYRIRPTALYTETKILLALVWLAMLAGAVWAVRRRAWAVGAFLLISVVAHVYVMRNGSPWADGKALMIVSPAMVLLAVAAAGAAAARRTLAGLAVVAAVGGGVLWSNALAYHEVANAPRERMEELAQVGERIAGKGPALYPDFEEFAKHFLREGDPEGVTEGWQRRYSISATREGEFVRQGLSVDIDRLTDRYMREYATIVMRRGYASSRPGSDFRRTWRGRFYEIWERRGRRMVEHLSLGAFRDPSAIPDCAALRRLARRADTLAYVERPRNVVQVAANVKPLPGGWYVDQTDPAAVVPRGPGLVELRLDVPRDGRWDIWLEGSFGRGVEVRIDGRPVGEVRGRLNGRGSAEHVATAFLTAGPHTVRLLRGGGTLAPGNGGLGRLIGPLALTPEDPGGLPVATVASERWRELCDRELDWVEAIRG